MKKLPNISQAEWDVMKVFWSKSSPLTAMEVIDILDQSNSWKPSTVKSLINRLVKKNALGFEKSGKTYYYTPMVSEEECIKAESKSFLKRLYGGAVKPMLVNFIKNEKLTPEEIEELKQILDERKD